MPVRHVAGLPKHATSRRHLVLGCCGRQIYIDEAWSLIMVYHFDQILDTEYILPTKNDLPRFIVLPKESKERQGAN
jgi:hypothetical protein